MFLKQTYHILNKQTLLDRRKGQLSTDTEVKLNPCPLNGLVKLQTSTFSLSLVEKSIPTFICRLVSLKLYL